MKNCFWSGKIPCWEMHDCPEIFRNECPAYTYRFSGHPCWEIEGTFCKINPKDGTATFLDRCYNCNVYMKYGEGEPITIKMRSHGKKHHSFLQALMNRQEYVWLRKHASK